MNDTAQELRNNMRQWRAKLSPKEREIRSKRVVNFVLEYLKNSKEEYEDFLCYYPLSEEVDLRPLYEQLLQQGKQLYFPKTYSKQIVFYRVSDLSMFTQGRFHVMEPVENEVIYQSETEKTFACIPGLVFDKHCQRIGYGGGYYDRFLVDRDNIVKCGVCFKEQVVDNILSEPWDVLMDMIITDRKNKEV